MHRIVLQATAAQRRDLEALGVKIIEEVAMLGDNLPLIVFKVAEDEPIWPKVRALVHQWGELEGQGPVLTEFSPEEIESAQWLDLGAWHHGYPQPQEDFGYLQVTYDLSRSCDKCGMGSRQNAPFRMKGEPRWGRRGILQMNWVFDELFVKPEVWAGVFKPHGIGCMPVLNRKGATLKTVVQLVIDEEIGIVTEDLSFERCMKCGRVKYSHVTRGPRPALSTTPSHAMVKTKEYFGDGTVANKAVLISQAVARSLMTAKVRGASLWPVHSG